MSLFLDELQRRVLVFDGAMGTSIHSLDLDLDRDYWGKENCTEVLVLSRPDAIQSIHESFLAVGADAVETDTFGANKLVLAEFDLADRCREINATAAKIARAACAKFTAPSSGPLSPSGRGCPDAIGTGEGSASGHPTTPTRAYSPGFSTRPRFVAGSIGPGTKLITLGNTSWEIMLDSYTEQARGLLDGGVDVFLIETAQDLLQIKCAINACLAALVERGQTTADVPIMAQVTIETTGTMLLGTEIAAAANALAVFPILSLGMNCATGPTEMAEHIHWLGRHWDRYISVLPNAGLPVLVDGRTEYPLRPEPFAQAVLRYVEEAGVNIVGGCCGTTPEHIRLLAQAVAGRPPVKVAKTPPRPGCSSLYETTDYRQDSSVLIVGERCNASGSRAFKKLLEKEDWDAMVSLAREQVRENSHILDVNVDYAGRDNGRDMAELVHRFVRQVNAPLMLDSTQPATLEAGLQCAGGKCLVNSANLEDGEAKFARMMSLVKRYGAAVVLGCIDEDKEEAMARTADRKLTIATRLYKLAVEQHGLNPGDIFFDPLVLPISTGMEKDRRSALETIEGVRRIARAFPECQILAGLSNVSFGLKPAARVVLNSVFLHELVAAGLTSAILHASKILPRPRIPDEQWNAALDVIYDRRGNQSGFGVQGSGFSQSGSSVAVSGAEPEPRTLNPEPSSSNPDPLQRFIALFSDEDKNAKSQTAATPAASLSLEERLQRHIIDGEKRHLIPTLEEARKQYAPLEIINDHLLAGMKVVGELFGSGQMQLPFVLQSAEVMKMAVAHLQQYMEKDKSGGGQSKGTIVLATVKGDVHDIGKNLVDIILSNNGYTVFNLGIKQPISAIIEKWREHQADAIGLSGLLVKSVTVMQENLEELNAQDIRVPLLLGGAALSRHYCESELRSGYQGKLYYGRDAFEGLRIMDYLKSGRAAVLDGEVEERLSKRAATEAKIAAQQLVAVPGARQMAGAPGCSPAPPESKATTTCGCGVPHGPRSVGAVASPTTTPGAGVQDAAIPTPPFWGDRMVEQIDLDAIYPFINRVALFRGQWQFKKGRMEDADYQDQIDQEIEPLFDRLKRQCKAEGILLPKVVYGYFPCHAQGDDLIVYDPTDHAREIERFTFPRQAGRQHLCISDFFRASGGGVKDVLGLSCVTIGHEATRRTKALFAANQYTEYLYLHGLSVESAEALAELWHKRMRQELGFGNEDSPRIRDLFTQHYRGSRYSFGYPACPDMSDQAKLFRLLQPERIGCTLTENWQIDPEQSTSALIVHHPQAKYFAV